MASLQVETAPLAEPVTLALAKQHLRVTITDDDALITLYLKAARGLVENFTARSLVNKGYRQCLDSFPYFVDTVMSQMAYPPSYYSLPRYSTTLWNYSQMMKLFFSPLVKVTRIDYLDAITQEWQYLYPAPFNWAPNTEFTIGDQVVDSNGNLQEVTAVTEADEDETSESGSNAPTWANILTAATTDGDITWTCKQIPAPTGDFIYDSNSEPPRIFPLAGQNWPGVLYVPNAVIIHYVAGYGNDGNACPPEASVAILQLVASWYENREAVSPDDLSREIPHHVQDLLWNIRVLDMAPTRG